MDGGVSIIIPTLGRPSLTAVLAALPAEAELEHEVLVVDDRPAGGEPLALPPDRRVRVLATGGAGPAAARNLGWRAARHGWVAFLDDDVVPDPDWLDRLATDLEVPVGVGGVQGKVRVPLPAGRRPSDRERGTAGLAGARWITADLAYRREALARAGGFDQRFPRAYREDAELAHRVRRAGWRLVRGTRAVTHPVRPAGPWASLAAQRGNADDALLRHLYGHRWQADLEIAPGRRPRHVATTVAGAVGLLAAAVAGLGPGGAARRAAAVVAGGCAAGWLAGTAELASARIAPGPLTTQEVAVMVVTSVLIPPLATAHWVRGWWAGRGARPVGGSS